MAKRRLTAAASLRWGIAALVLFLLIGYGVTYFRQQRTIHQAQARIDELNAVLAQLDWKLDGYEERMLKYEETLLPRVYLKKEEATARADFSSVQGGKPKV